jgi:uncharacterized repeat protein (TIGR01451 family)
LSPAHEVFAQDVAIVQTFYVPITEEQSYSAMRAISVGSPVTLPATNVMFSAWGIVPSDDSTIIYFDHWEDGYEADIFTPTQATTQVWGNNDPASGIPPGFATDIINAGDYISLTNTMSVPRDISELRYDGRDKLVATKPIATTRAQYAVNPGQVLASASQAPDITRWGTEFIAPVGTNTPSNSSFTYSAITVIAAEDDTLVNFDVNANGATDFQIWLDEGETYMVTNVMAGARVLANKPVQAHLLTGTLSSYYVMRWFMLFPSYQWDSEYYAPVGSMTNADAGITPTMVYLRNPNASNITVFYETSVSNNSVTLSPNSTASITMPFDTGARFFTTNDAVFFGICVVDGGANQPREWGYGLMPKKMLSTMAICAWGQGSGDLSQNANPVWVSVTSNATLYVDYDSNPSTGAFTDPTGRKYDLATNVTAYQKISIYDNLNNDKDQTATRVYVLSNALLSAAWGQDPRASLTGNPYLDMGCEVLPSPTVTAEKKNVLANDLNGNSVIDPGDTIRYTITIRNIGWVAANNVVVFDSLPENTAYVLNSTTTNGFAVPDNPGPSSPFPLDEGGLLWGSLAIGATGTVSYQVTVDSPFPTNAFNLIANSAVVSSPQGGTATHDPEPVNLGGLVITKTANPTNRVYAGSNITYTVTIQNTGTFAQTMVRIGDILPPGVTFVTGSLSAVSSTLGSSTVQFSASGTFTVPAGVTSVTVEARGGGGGGGGRSNTGLGGAGGGGGGAYARGMVAVVPGTTTNVVVGAGGAGGPAGNNNGSPGGSSYFGASNVLAVGGSGGNGGASGAGGAGGSIAASIGTTKYNGGDGAAGTSTTSGGGGGGAGDANDGGNAVGTVGGAGGLDGGGAGANGLDANGVGLVGSVPGGGGSGGRRRSGGTRAGGAGATGRVDITYSYPLPVSVGDPPILTSNLTLAVGETVTVTFRGTVSDPITATQFVNSAWVVSAQNPGRTYAYGTTYPVSADLAVFKSVNNATPNTNDLIGYSVVLTNIGPDNATNIVVNDLLPSDVSYVSHSQSQGSYSGATGIWTAGTVNASGFATLWITGRVAAGTGGQTITNTAQITNSSLVDPNPNNNTSSVPITVTLADLAVFKSVDNPTPATNDLLTYTIVVTNLGPNDATGVAINDVVPASLTYSGYSASSGTYNNVTGIWTVGTIRASNSVSLTLQATVNAGTEDTAITNTATVRQLNQQEVSLLNNTGSVIVAVAGLDIGVSKIVNNYEPNTNDVIVYTIAVTNFGPSAATGVQVTDSLPVGVTYSSHGTSAGTYNNGTGLWDIGNLGIGSVATLVVTAQVNSGTAGSVITNTARLTAVDQADYNPANNVSSAIIRVQSADLTIGKSVDKAMANELDLVSFTVSLTNKGPSAATGVTVSDVLPAGLTYSSYSTLYGTYNNVSGVWSVGTVASGAVATLTLSATVNAGTIGNVITNIAAITSSQQFDPDSANHSATAKVTVINARLSMSKSSAVSESPLYFGDTITYTVVVTNEGNISQTGLTVTDPVPTGATFVSSSAQVTAPRHVTNMVLDIFSATSYGNNNGTANWIVNWDEAGTDDEDPATGFIRIFVQNLRIESNNRIVRRMANLQGATNAVLSFLWRRDGLDDATDYVAIEVSSNGYAGTWTELWRVAGPGTEALFSSTNFNITAYIASNTSIRFVSSATLGAADYVYLDDVKITYYGRQVTTLPGNAPSVLAAGLELWTNETVTVTYQIAVDNPTTYTQLVNVASVTSAQHLAVLTARTTNEVAKADLVVTKSVNNATPTVGATIDYTIVVSNAGPHEARGVEMTDPLPDGLSYSNATPSQGMFNTNTLAWSVGTIAVNGSASLVLRVVLAYDDAYAGISITNWANVTGRRQIELTVTNDSGHAVITPKSTLAVIGSFGAHGDGGRVVLEWETVTEAGTVGFYVYRSGDGRDYELVREDLLPGLLTSPQGGRYRLVDPEAEVGRSYWYRLCEVEAEGSQNWFGPYEVKVEGKALSRGVMKSVEAGNGAEYERVVREETEGKKARGSAREAAKALNAAQTTEQQLTGNEVKLVVKERGVYAVEAKDLAKLLGVSKGVVQQLIATYRLELLNRGERVTYFSAAAGERFYFFGEKIESIYTDENVYWLRMGQGLAPKIIDGGAPAAASAKKSYIEKRWKEENRQAVPALFKKDDADFWVWDYLIAGNPDLGVRNFEIASESRATEGEAEVVVRLVGGSRTGLQGEHRVVVAVNGVEACAGNWTGLNTYELRGTVGQGVLVDGVNTVEVRAVLGAGVPYSVVYVDKVGLNYNRYYKAEKSALEADAAPKSVVTIRGFDAREIGVFEVSNPKRLQVVTGTRIEKEAANNFRVSFRNSRNQRLRCAAFSRGAAKRVERMEAGRASGLTAKSNRANYVILTDGLLKGAAEELASYRAEQGYETKVVDLKDVFDTFNYGIVGPEGIREFLRYAYYYWSLSPEFVVLAGEGTFDPRNILGHGDNVVLPKMVGTPHGMYESDTWYVDVVGDDGVPEMAVGRLPVLTAEELGLMVEKIAAYESGEDGTGWANRVLLVADNADEGGAFPADSDWLGQWVPEGYTKTRIYLSELTTAAARTAIQAGVKNGALLMHYIGHGGMDRLAQEGMLLNSHVGSLTNGTRHPVLVALTCMTGRYGVPGSDCLAELLLLKPEGGMVGVWSPTGQSMNEQAKKLGEGFLRGCFEDGVPTLGELVLQSLEDYGAAGEPKYMLYIYSLLGDPALEMK